MMAAFMAKASEKNVEVLEQGPTEEVVVEEVVEEVV